MIHLYGQLQREPLAHFRWRGKWYIRFDIGTDPARPALKHWTFTEVVKMHPDNRHALITWLYKQSQAGKRALDQVTALTEILNTRNPERQVSRDMYVKKLYEDIEEAIAA